LPREYYSAKAVIGNGIALGMTDGTNYAGLYSDDTTALSVNVTKYGVSIGTDVTGAQIRNKKVFGITTDSTKSGIIVSSDSNKHLMFYLN